MRVLSARIPLLLANALRATEEDIAPAEPEQRCGTVWPPLARKHGRAFDDQTTASRTVLLHVLPRSVVRKIWAREFNSAYGKTHTISDDSLPSPWSEFWDWRRLQSGGRAFSQGVAGYGNVRIALIDLRIRGAGDGFEPATLGLGSRIDVVSPPFAIFRGRSKSAPF